MTLFWFTGELEEEGYATVLVDADNQMAAIVKIAEALRLPFKNINIMTIDPANLVDSGLNAWQLSVLQRMPRLVLLFKEDFDRFGLHVATSEEWADGTGDRRMREIERRIVS